MENSPKQSIQAKLLKYFAMALFIILPFVGFYLGMQFQKSQDDISANPYLVIKTK